MGKRGCAAALVCCLLLVLSAVGEAHAETEDRELSCGVELVKQEEDRYVFQVTAENAGADFSGTLRLMFTNYNSDVCAYDTRLDLPADGKKQFTLTIPANAVGTTGRSSCVAVFLDSDGEEAGRATLKNVTGSASGFAVGLLSDAPEDLSYLDCGGQDFYMMNTSAPLELVELDADTLTDQLDGLYFLVIDRFDTASLTEEALAAIADWVEDGGWLLVGTGAYAKETLGALSDAFLGFSAWAEDNGTGLVFSNAERNGYYYSYLDAGVDFSSMELVNFVYPAYYWESGENPALCAGIGDGAVSVYACSLGDAELQKCPTSVYSYMLEETMDNSQSYSNLWGYSDMSYLGERAMNVIDQENTEVDFSVLKLLIAVYVVLVGPVLYLILKKCKKSEWYWGGAPALGLVFILCVFLFGRGIRVTETKVFSVSLLRAESTEVESYYNAYHSGTAAWNMRLKAGYEVAGPGFDGDSYFSGSDYHYLVQNDGGALLVGMKPQENFESGSLYAAGQVTERGGFSCESLSNISGSFEGTVTNGTGSDLAYLALCSDSYVMIVADIGAGETLELAQAVKDGRCVLETPLAYQDDLFYNLLNLGGSGSSYSVSSYTSTYAADLYGEVERDDMAALFIGIGTADEKRELEQQKQRESLVSLVGLVADAGETVESSCDETAYACIYDFAGLALTDSGEED